MHTTSVNSSSPSPTHLPHPAPNHRRPLFCASRPPVRVARVETHVARRFLATGGHHQHAAQPFLFEVVEQRLTRAMKTRYLAVRSVCIGSHGGFQSVQRQGCVQRQERGASTAALRHARGSGRAFGRCVVSRCSLCTHLRAEGAAGATAAASGCLQKHAAQAAELCEGRCVPSRLFVRARARRHRSDADAERRFSLRSESMHAVWLRQPALQPRVQRTQRLQILITNELFNTSLSRADPFVPSAPGLATPHRAPRPRRAASAAPRRGDAAPRRGLSLRPPLPRRCAAPGERGRRRSLS